MGAEEIRETLERYRSELEARGVRSLALFGSTVRGEAGPQSDVDLLVDLDPGAGIGLMGYIGLEHRLGEILGCKVDLIAREALERSIRDCVDAEARPVF